MIILPCNVFYVRKQEVQWRTERLDLFRLKRKVHTYHGVLSKRIKSPFSEIQPFCKSYIDSIQFCVASENKGIKKLLLRFSSR